MTFLAYIILKHFILFLFIGCAEYSLLCRLFSSCGELGLLSGPGGGAWLLTAMASLVAEHSL